MFGGPINTCHSTSFPLILELSSIFQPKIWYRLCWKSGFYLGFVALELTTYSLHLGRSIVLLGSSLLWNRLEHQQILIEAKNGVFHIPQFLVDNFLVSHALSLLGEYLYWNKMVISMSRFKKDFYVNWLSFIGLEIKLSISV